MHRATKRLIRKVAPIEFWIDRLATESTTCGRAVWTQFKGGKGGKWAGTTGEL
jgi:hypothetical protein